MNKSDLKVGDLIRFHSWSVGGFLFGVIIEHEDDFYHSKLNIWRPKDIYYLADRGIDAIELIKSVEDVKEWQLHDFYEILDDIKKNNIYCRFCD